mmetsp:Transcript_79323/g.256873  ORF Transcript_79323/g.256873 Transcript_79323/m.256873 type:complete len:205 (-) Transcript_79323:1126-1740(-)
MEGHLGLVPAVHRAAGSVREKILLEHGADLQQLQALLHKVVLAPALAVELVPATRLAPEVRLHCPAGSDLNEAIELCGVELVALEEVQTEAVSGGVLLHAAAQPLGEEDSVGADLCNPVVMPEAAVFLHHPPGVEETGGVGRILRCRDNLRAECVPQPVTQLCLVKDAEYSELITGEDTAMPGELVPQGLGLVACALRHGEAEE